MIAGGWYDTAAGADPSIALRLKEEHDGAEPAASSVAAANCVRLAALLPDFDTAAAGAAAGDGAAAAAGASGSAAAAASASGGGGAAAGGGGESYFLSRADGALAASAGRLSGRAAIISPQMCASAWLRARAPLRQIIIAGPAGAPATRDLLAAAAAGGGWLRDAGVICIDPGSPAERAFWGRANARALAMVDAAAAKGGGGGGSFPPTAFVCQDYTCKAPTRDAGQLLALLRAGAAPAGSGGAKLAEFKWPAGPGA